MHARTQGGAAEEKEVLDVEHWQGRGDGIQSRLDCALDARHCCIPAHIYLRSTVTASDRQRGRVSWVWGDSKTTELGQSI